MTKRRQKQFIESKSGLAKLLATENLHLVHDPESPTAYIDLKNRVITLPVLKDMTGPMYNAFICHEVSHALNTPKKGWMEFCDEYPGIFLNVTEDVRIERLIQQKYPGSRRDFHLFYKELVERDFFGIKGKDLNDFTILDKLNLHFKIGTEIDVPFEAGIETDFKNRLDKIQTFEEARDIAIEIYEYMKEEGQVEEIFSQVDLEFAPDDDDEDQDGSSGKGSSGDQDGDGSQSGKGKTVKVNAKPNGEKEAKNGKKKGGKYAAGQTRKAFTENCEREIIEFDKNGRSAYGDVYDAKDIYNKFIISEERIRQTLKARMHRSTSTYYNRHGTFVKNVKPVVSHMVNRFNMRKSAQEYKKIQTSSSGRLNGKKIAQYRVRKDIFLQSETLPTAQNHGIVMVIDLSGSMIDNLKGTLEQVFILTEFCRKLRIPYEVYGFTDFRWGSSYSKPHVSVPKNQMFFDPHGYLPCVSHILSSHDRKDDHDFKCQHLYAAAINGNFSERAIEMGSTPLTGTAFMSEYLLREFRMRHSNEKVSFILLSDGCSNDDTNRSAQKLHMRNPMNGKVFSSDNSKMNPFHTVFSYVKDRTNIHSMMGFFITDGYCDHLANYICPQVQHNHQKNNKEFRSNGFCILPESVAFDNFYVINLDKFSVDKGGRGMVSSAKQKMIFLNSFIDRIS